MGTAGLHLPATDCSGHCRASSASSRSQYAGLQPRPHQLLASSRKQWATAGLHLPAPDRSGHCRASSASSRSQWALPDFNWSRSRSQWALPDFSRDCQIAVGTAGLQPRLPDRRALPDFSRDRQIAVGTAGLHGPAPDRSGHCRILGSCGMQARDRH
eukprot:s3065_g13.t1